MNFSIQENCIFVSIGKKYLDRMDDFKKSILIVEDEIAIAEDLLDILEQAGYRVSGIAGDYQSAVESLQKKPPDLILIDINLKSSKSGLDLANFIREKYQIPFIFLTSYADEKTIIEVVDLRPIGYLVKPYKERDIVASLALAFASIESVESSFPSRDYLSDICETRISKQEYKVLELMMEAHTNAEIGKLLFVSTNTIKSHVSSIYTKLKVRSKVQAVQKVNAIISKNKL